MTRQVPWPRIAAEGAAIVVSILLAFALQAWWEGRQRVTEERDLLERLEAELADVDSVLAEWQQHHADVLDAVHALLEHTGPLVSSTISPDDIGALVFDILATWNVDPPTATISSLESSGRIGLIRSQEILTQLALWRSLLADLQGDEGLLQRYTYETIQPFLNAHASYRSVAAQSRDPQWAGTASRFTDGLRELLANREFEGHLELVRVETVNILGDYGVVRESLMQLQTLIREDLGG